MIFLKNVLYCTTQRVELLSKREFLLPDLLITTNLFLEGHRILSYFELLILLLNLKSNNDYGPDCGNLLANHNNFEREKKK